MTDRCCYGEAGLPCPACNPPEPRIQINGIDLTEAQAMSVRVAIGSFLLLNMDPDCLGEDAHGRRMAQAYSYLLMEVQKLMGEA